MMAGFKGSLDKEDERLIGIMRNDLLRRGFDEAEIFRQLKRHFGRQKVENILNGTHVFFRSLMFLVSLCGKIESVEPFHVHEPTR